MSSTYLAPISRPGTKHAGFNVFGLTELIDHKPRHLARRADVEPDTQPTATCVNAGSGMWCGDWKCPRHNPESYADCMARHATDSLNRDLVPVRSGCGHVTFDMPRQNGVNGDICAECWF